MVEVTIDGQQISVPEGSMVMHAAQELGIFVPHFCYHKKLSIAASCRMCLVEVEKAPKALPACATPCTNGMVVHTCSAKAVAAQKAVMEFLLINHPLDCPICDQGGECMLQDLAVGYGQDASRYQEEKRVVFHKEIGPLISTEEMSRCIHCTRCVRFGQEISGIMELGMLNRNEHSEIATFMGGAVESELSGNAIDLCPVGALTSKPFRYSARTWELARRRSVTPHDSVGSNLVVQVKNDRVMRVVPFEVEDINECWISNRDRFSYEGLECEDRLTQPMIKGDDGIWRESSWEEAITAAAQALGHIKQTKGAERIGALATEYSTVEELALMARLVRALGSDNIDFRLRQTDDALTGLFEGVPYLGAPIADLSTADRVVVIGSDLRAEHPLLAQRLRQACKKGCQMVLIDSEGQDPYIDFLKAHLTVKPSEMAHTVQQLAEGQGDMSGLLEALQGGEKALVLLGNAAMNHPNAAQIASQAQVLATRLGARFGVLTSGANTVGAYLAGATPLQGGQTAHQMLKAPLDAYLVLHAEPLYDCANGQEAVKTLASSFAIALTAYKSAAQDWARIMLPVGPFTETSGTFVNAEGRAQSFKGVVAGKGLSRPAWKVLRVLGNILKLDNFDDETSESVRDSVLREGYQAGLNNTIAKPVSLVAGEAPAGSAAEALERVAPVPVYRTDSIVRRAPALQETTASQAPKAYLNAAMLAKYGLKEGDMAVFSSPEGRVSLTVALGKALADGTVSIAQTFANTAALGSAFTHVTLERQ